MADWAKPAVGSTYTNYTAEINAKFSDLALGLDPALVTQTGPLTNSVRYNSANRFWEKYNGTAWSELTAGVGFAISITGGAAKLTTARAIAVSGDITGTVNFDGTAGVSIASTLATVNANVGAWGSASNVPTFTVNAKGLVTAASNTAISIGWAQISSGKPTTLAGYGIADSVTNGGTVPSMSSGTFATRPAAASAGRLYIASDTGETWRDTGAAWELMEAALSGDVSTAAKSGVTTLATVNANTGSGWGNATQTPALTLDGKGRVTAASLVTITPAWGSVTGKPTTLGGYGITDGAPLASPAFTGTPSFAGTITLAAGTTSIVPIKFRAGVLLTTATAHSAEWDGTYMYLSNASAQRKAVAYSDGTGASGTWNISISGLAGSASAVAWSGVSAKPTTLSGYGITDAVSNGGGTPSVTQGAAASRPGFGVSGRIYIATDTGAISRDTGTVWEQMQPAFSGDATSAAKGTVLTLATVNSNVGSYGSATAASTFTVNGKGLITAAGSVTITPAWTSITGKPAPNGVAFIDASGNYSASTASQIVSAIGSTYVSNASYATGAGSAGSATNVAGGSTGQVHVQTGTGATGFITPGAAGTALISNGSTVAPSFQSIQAFASGTRIPFAQAAAPTGWTQDVTDAANDRMLRVVNTAGNGTGGTATHSPILMNVVPSHTHGFTTGTVSADHSHGIGDPGHWHHTALASSANTTYGIDTVIAGIAGSSYTTSYSTITDARGTGIWTGGISANHTHSGSTDNGSSQTSWAPRYINLIICSKD